MISQEYLKSILHYNHDTGVFHWIKPRSRVHVGMMAGAVNKRGYMTIMIDGKSYYAHRLAFVYMAGYCPAVVDHINRKRTDNRWDNLRETTVSLNLANSKKRKNTISKYKGVGWYNRDKKWRAEIGYKGKKYPLGSFESEIEAAKAYDIAAFIYYGGYANLNFP